MKELYKKLEIVWDLLKDEGIGKNESKGEFEWKFNLEPQEYTFNKTVKYIFKNKIKITTVTRTVDKDAKKKP